MDDQIRIHKLTVPMRVGVTAAIIAGVPVGAIAAAVVDVFIDDKSGAFFEQFSGHSAAAGVLAGSLAGVLVGVVAGLIGGHLFQPVRERIDFDDKERFRREWNVGAAQRAYRLSTGEDGDYLLYETGNLGPLALGPLTVTTTYMNMTVQLFSDHAAVVGPKQSVEKIMEWLEAASAERTPQRR